MMLMSFVTKLMFSHLSLNQMFDSSPLKCEIIEFFLSWYLDDNYILIM